MRNRIFTVVFSVALLAGCAPNALVLINGVESKYPSSQYLIGRGEGANGEEARDRARADLAKIFEVNVSVESEDVQAFRSAAGGQYEGRSTRRITARTDRVVEGIEIAEAWQNLTTKTHHALAVLSRPKAATALRQEIDRLDEATRLQVERARDAQDLLLKIAAAAQAVSLQNERTSIQRTLRVVDPSGAGREPSWNPDKLRADLDALLKRVKVVPRITTDSSESLEPVAKGALAAAGFLADSSENPDYTLEASLALDDLGRLDGWYWQRGTLEVRLLETTANRVRGTRRWSIKSSALTYEGAVQRTVTQADAILKKELRSTLIGFTADARAP